MTTATRPLNESVVSPGAATSATATAETGAGPCVGWRLSGVARRLCHRPSTALRTGPSTAGERHPECRHLLAVANEQHVAHKHRVVPRFSGEDRDPRDLLELIRGRPDQRQLAFLRQHEQQVLIGQKYELTAAVAPTFPFALAVARSMDERMLPSKP